MPLCQDNWSWVRDGQLLRGALEPIRRQIADQEWCWEYKQLIYSLVYVHHVRRGWGGGTERQHIAQSQKMWSHEHRFSCFSSYTTDKLQRDQKMTEICLCSYSDNNNSQHPCWVLTSCFSSLFWSLRLLLAYLINQLNTRGIRLWIIDLGVLFVEKKRQM